MTQGNLEAIKQAAILYPIVALLFTLPYVGYCYKKYGSVFSLRIVVMYSFVLYLLCVYCLVILPLPTAAEAEMLHGHKMKLIPFHCIHDIIKNSCFQWNVPGSWLSLFNHSFFTNFWNIIMTLPFGVYLRYYYRCGWKRTLLFSFCLSLFFELTQLSGLYFIYPGTYRLFDVDDLIMNTLGGMAGFALARPLTRWLPSRTELDRGSFARSNHISLLRRLLAMAYDGAVAAILCALLNWVGLRFPLWIVPVYFVLSPILLRGRGLGLRLTNLAIRRNDGSLPGWKNLLVRYLSLMFFFFLLPMGANCVILKLFRSDFNHQVVFIAGLAVNGGYFFLLVFQMLRAAIHRPLIHERLSRTRLISTLNVKKEMEELDELEKTANG